MVILAVICVIETALLIVTAWAAYEYNKLLDETESEIADAHELLGRMQIDLSNFTKVINELECEKALLKKKNGRLQEALNKASSREEDLRASVEELRDRYQEQIEALEVKERVLDKLAEEARRDAV